MCVLMLPSRGVSAVVDADVQSWPPRGYTGFVSCAAAAGTGATGVDGQSVTRLSRVSHKAARGGQRPAGRHRSAQKAKTGKLAWRYISPTRESRWSNEP